MRLAVLLIALALWWASHPASAGAQTSLCRDAAVLARLHDGYAALVRARSAPAQDAALVLLAIDLPAFDADRLARLLRARSIEADAGRLRAVAAEAGGLARAKVENRPDDQAIARHTRNLYWLSGLILATGCQDRWSSDGTSGQGGRGGLAGVLPGIDTGAATDMRLVAGGLGGLLAVAVLFVFVRSHRFRSGQLNRLPRKSVFFHAKARFSEGPQAGQSLDVHVLDLSVGGAKVAWAEAPSEKTPLTLVIGSASIPASIVWRNEFCAGLLFETRLTSAELNEFLRLSDRQADARSARARISAPQPPPSPPAQPRRARG